MKKILSIVAIVALFATSCVKSELDNVQVVPGGEEVVTLTLQTPNLGSRAAIAEGEKATDLHYAIYDENWNALVVEQTTINISTTIEVRLVKNKEYNFVFWAQSPSATCYTLNLGAVGDLAVTPSIDVTYNGLANDDHRDAFFGQKNLTVNGTVNETVYLKRPFAQINFGTNDAAKAKVAGYDIRANDVTTKFTTRAYTSLNLATGEATGETDVVFEAAALPEVETFTTTLGTHDWLAMNYLLWPDAADLSLSTCKMEIAVPNQQPVVVEYPMAPARRNYRTNLVGSLLTEEGDIEVIILPATDGDYTNTLGFYKQGGSYYILNAAGLDYFAAQVAAGNEEWLTANVILAEDIDLSVTRAATDNWTPISMTTDYHKTFRGSFDGAGHKISNMVVTNAKAAALFGYLYSGEIRNVTIENPTVNGNHYAAGLVAWINDNTGNDSKPTIIENCHIIGGTITSTPEEVNGEWDNGDKVGGLVGYGHFGSATREPHADSKIANCSVKNTKIKAYRDLGGVMGYGEYAKLVNVAVENVALEQDLSHDYKSSTPTTISAIIGNTGAGGNVQENVTTSGVEFDGVVEGYASLADAFANAPDEAVITLKAGLALAEYPDIPAGKTLTLDLNGQNLTAAGDNNYVLAVEYGAKLTINDTANSAVVTGIVYTGAGSETTVNGGTFNAKEGGNFILLNSGGKLTINGGTVNSCASYSVFSYNANNELVINDVTVNGTFGCIDVYGDNSKATINGGTYNMTGVAGNTSHIAYFSQNSTITINGGSFNKVGNISMSGTGGGGICATGGSNVTIKGGSFAGDYADVYMYNNSTLSIEGGTFKFEPNASYLADGSVVVVDGAGKYVVSQNTSSARMSLASGTELDLAGVEFAGTIVAEGNLTIKGDTKIKTLTATNGGTITVEEGKTLTLNNFNFGSGSNPGQTYEITGGTVEAKYGFFQHGTYALRSNFETGYMYYSFGSDITVYGTFHSQGAGDGLDYVRGKLTIAAGGKSIHDNTLWVGQPASWGAMSASLTIEKGGYVEAKTLKVYGGSELIYYDDADLVYGNNTNTPISQEGGVITKM